MTVDKTQPGLTFPDKRQSRPHQESILRDAGAQHIIHVGKGCTDWREFVRSVREGDTVRIVALVQVATERGADPTTPSGQPAEFILEVHERGGTVIETWTGRKSNDPKQRRAMIADAVRSLRGGGRRLPPSGKEAGRPAKKFSETALVHNRKCWFSKMYGTNEVAEAHMLEGMTARDAWKVFGKSGRPFSARTR